MTRMSDYTPEEIEVLREQKRQAMDAAREAVAKRGYELHPRIKAARDSGSDPQGENSRSEVECAASQSGAEGNRPPLSTERTPHV